MHAPECLKERFKAADGLVQELSESRCVNENCSIEEPGVKLLCHFWNILKDNPTLNLTEAVKEQTKKIQKQNLSIPLNVTNLPCSSDGSSDVICECSGDVCTCSSDSGSKKSTPCCSLKAPREPPAPDAPPLTRAIYNINEAASIGKKCGSEIKTLMAIQKELEEEVKVLEDKEKEVVATLKQTDCMWMCMEEAYKKKIEDALANQDKLMKELKEAEASKAKWKKNQKDLELEVTNVDNCHKEMQEKTKEKANDLKSIETEVKNLKKQIADTKKDLESTRKLADNKKKTCDKKLANMAAQVKKLEKTLEDERKKKHENELQGNRSLREARDELQYQTKVLMKKKLENGDMTQEKQMLTADMDALNQMASQCFVKCSDREKSIDDEIARTDQEIAEFRTRCLKCHECTHTIDIKAFCMECPRCTQDDCLTDCCGSDKTDCVCMYVKEKFMSNVLENICTVLKRHSQTQSGIAVAESVLNSLKRSRNGKLDGDTRRKLQDFIVSAMRKNLNDSIVGGAVKTRCELDENTYNQLMRCLKEVRVELLSIDDDNKVCCPRFDKTHCNCPGGPDGCVCQSVCPGGVKPKSSISSKTKGCSSNAEKEVVLWKTEPCEVSSCKTVTSMRAVQCGLGPEVLTRESVAQAKCCDGCQVYPNISNSGTVPYSAVSSSCKDVQKVQSSWSEKYIIEDGKCDHCTSKKSTNFSGDVGKKTKSLNFEHQSLYSLKTPSPNFPNIDSFFVIKKTNVGNYEMVLNKEFEDVIKKNLKEHELNIKSSTEYIFKFKESKTGHRVIEIEPKSSDNNGKDAVIVRTSSGTLRLFSTDSYSDYKRKNPNDTIVTKEDFMNLLMKFQYMSDKDTKTESIQTCWSKKSKSDSNVYQTTKVNLNNEQCYMEIHEVLKRTNSGNYIITLNKISCKEDLTEPAKKNYVKIPITYNKGVTLKHRVKVSACKCAHIFVNKYEINDIINKCSNLMVKYDSKDNINICKGVQSENISARAFKSRSRDSNMGSICTEMKKLEKSSPTYRECCQKCVLTNPDYSGTKVNESCALILKKILENPPTCNTKHCQRHDCSNAEESCNCNIVNTNINNRDYDRQRRNFLLRSLENLPPQLPMFLKGFNMEMA